MKCSFAPTENAPRRTRLHAFTLIELLVVIAIIAILATILFPVFAQARAKARQTACLSNEKQIGLALMQYAQDYDETLPIETYGVWNGFIANDPRSPKWMDIVFPYVKNIQLFTCPSFTGDTHWKYIYQPGDLPVVRGGPFYGTYALNSAYYNETKVSAHGPSGKLLAAIGVPATTIWCTETGAPGINRNAVITWANYTVNAALITTNDPPTLNTNQGIVSYLNHTAGMNATFCDGHAKWYKGSDIIATHPVGNPPVPIEYLWTIEED